MRRRRVVAALAVVACGIGAASAYAAFSKTTSNPSNTITAKRIFANTTTTSAWQVSDQADGTAANATDQGAVAGDGRTFNTGSWGSSFSSTRWTETTFTSALPPSLTVSGAQFNFTYNATNAADTVCFYIETRRTSTGALIQAHGSSGSPLRCATGTAVQTVNTPLSEIATSADANDLTVRVYTSVSGLRPVTVDQGVVTGTASNGFGSFTLNETKYVDQASGSNFQFPYGVAAVGGATTTFSAWTAAFGTSRFLQFTFPSTFVPSGATINSATLTHVYRSNTSGKSTCVYYEVWNGATLIVSKGSSGSAFSCSDTANNWKTDSISLPEVNTAAEVNGLFVKVFGRDTQPGASQHDAFTLTVNYHLD
jgi:hypothetical protein